MTPLHNKNKNGKPFMAQILYWLIQYTICGVICVILYLKVIVINGNKCSDIYTYSNSTAIKSNFVT